MTTEYVVMVDHGESNEVADMLSITGRVNGIECAAKVRLSALIGLTAKKQKALKQNALIDDFEVRSKKLSVSETEGEKVTR